MQQPKNMRCSSPNSNPKIAFYYINNLMRRTIKFCAIKPVGWAYILYLSIQAAYAQPVGEFEKLSEKNSKTEQKNNSAPKLEFYNWLYGSSRRSWFEWHTITASVNSSLIESGIRVRGMGAIGGYADDIKGNESANIIASANELNDYILPSMGTVGKLYGMNGLGGLQFGYTYASEAWKISAFVGASVIRVWSLASNMTTQIIKFSKDPASLNGMRYGVLVSLEGEYHPTDQLMFSAWGIYTPAYNWGYVEIKSGVALPFKDILPAGILENAFIGPHIALSVSDGIRQPMLGGHLSGVKLGPVFLNLNGGYTHEPLCGSGFYSILETTVQF